MRFLLNALLIVLLYSGPAGFAMAEEKAEAPGDLKTVTLAVDNMDCPLCRITIRKALENVEGVQEAAVDYETQSARVTFDPALTNIDALTRATTDVGYPSTLKGE